MRGRECECSVSPLFLKHTVRSCSYIVISLLQSESHDNGRIPQLSAWFPILGTAVVQYQHCKKGSVVVRQIVGNMELSPLCNIF
jgi:hypothetical protein